MNRGEELKKNQLVLGRGDCYHTALANLFEIRCVEPWWKWRRFRLVHGYFDPARCNDKTRQGHAWLEVDGRKVLDQELGLLETVEAYYAFWKPTEIKRYTLRRAVREVIRSGHYGIWHGPEEKTGRREFVEL